MLARKRAVSTLTWKINVEANQCLKAYQLKYNERNNEMIIA
jgi:hypothetical protein